MVEINEFKKNGLKGYVLGDLHYTCDAIVVSSNEGVDNRVRLAVVEDKKVYGDPEYAINVAFGGIRGPGTSVTFTALKLDQLDALILTLQVMRESINNANSI